MRHYKKSELKSGFCSTCGEHVDNIVIGKGTCADCLNNEENVKAEHVDFFDDEEDDDL